MSDSDSSFKSMDNVFNWLWNHYFIYISDFIKNNLIVKILLGCIFILIVLRFVLPFSIKFIKGIINKN